jgi:hypothetical protein
MTTQNNFASAVSSDRPNGAGAAAILAAGIGAFLLAVLAIMGDKSAAVGSAMIFWKPTGPLSGVTTTAIVLWLAAWAILHARWRNRNVPFTRINAAAFILLTLGFLLTFPPIADLF